MYIGKVIGTVVSTIKISHLAGRTLLMVDQLNLHGEETGDYDIAVDVAQAGIGDTVLVLDEGNGARQVLGLDPGAIRAVIVGVVDEVPDLPTRDPEDDAFALEVLYRALGRPDPVAHLTELATLVRETAADDDELAGWTAAAGCSLEDTDEAVALAPIVATVAPTDLGPLDPTRRDAVLALEWADWLGAVVGLVRSGGGAVVNGESMVDAVNQCPEVTSTIPKQDRARIAWAFDVLTEYWEPLGLTADGALTARGVAVLPAALRWAWSR